MLMSHLPLDFVVRVYIEKKKVQPPAIDVLWERNQSVFTTYYNR